VEQLLPHLSGLSIEAVEQRDGVVVLSGCVRAATARCGRCRQRSGRVHGRYQRRLRDVAIAGVALLPQVQIRRFRCDNTTCPAATFAEQVDGLTAPHARLTPGLRSMLTQIGLALAGRAGSRLASVIGVTAGRDTLLRLVKSLPDPVPAENLIHPGHNSLIIKPWSGRSPARIRPAESRQWLTSNAARR
jgi:transposase